MTKQTSIQSAIEYMSGITQTIVRAAIMSGLVERDLVHVPTGRPCRLIALAISAETATVRFGPRPTDVDTVLIRDLGDFIEPVDGAPRCDRCGEMLRETDERAEVVGTSDDPSASFIDSVIIHADCLVSDDVIA